MSFWRRCAFCNQEMDFTWQAIIIGGQPYHPDCAKKPRYCANHDENVAAGGTCQYCDREDSALHALLPPEGPR